MSIFGDLLGETISEQGLSIKQFASEVKIDRSWLTNIINGKKVCPENRFNDIVNSGYFSAKQVEQLRYAYYRKNYTESEFNRINYIFKTLIKEKRRDNSMPPIKSVRNNVEVYGEQNVLSRLMYLLKDTQQIDRLYTTIPAKYDSLLDVMYWGLKDREPADWKYVLFLDNGITTNNDNSIFAAMHFAEIGFEVNSYGDINFEHLEDVGFYPYYLMVNNTVMMISSNFSNAIVTENEIIVSKYEQEFSHVFNKSVRLSYHFDNAISLMQSINYSKESLTEYSMLKSFFPVVFLDADIFIRSANPNLPNKEQLIQAVVNHYKDLISQEAKPSIMTTVDGIREFVNTGKVSVIPNEYLLNLSVDDRITVLEKFKNLILNRPEYVCKIINPSKLAFNAPCIELSNNGLITICGYDNDDSLNPNGYMGEWSLFINNKRFYTDIKNAFEFIISNQIVYSDETAIDVIDGFILELKALQKTDE